MFVCPKCKQPLVVFESERFLLCPGERLRYRIDDGVPVLLIDEATEESASEVDRWMKLAKEQGLTGA